MAKKREPTIYDGKSLPYLYKICNERGISKYVGKNEEECIALLVECDSKNTTKSEKESSVAKPEKSKVVKKEAIDELDDDILLDEESVNDEPAKEDEEESAKEDDVEIELDEEEPAKEDEEEPVKEDDEEPVKEDEDEEEPVKEDDDGSDIDEAADEIELEEEVEVEPKNKEKPKVAKKVVEEPVKTSKANTPKPNVKRSIAAAKKPSLTEKPKGKAKIDLEDTNVTSPFEETSAGYYVFEALKRAKKNSIEKLVELADKLIAKAGAKAPSNTTAKMKIIIQVINSGQKGTRWGRIERDDNGKYTYVAA